ncbi:hypothetical protein CVT24_000357 [Panaeolus cyanescens]|uniref:Exonuclease domain-containing protein n=1 Tax=Panaeolus cyanescens TaxID=181874 RepID=A0A409VRT7_9AGAR|nr:hypothetical protein CVT24_000357 [Panaeolus cyanescens]
MAMADGFKSFLAIDPENNIYWFISIIIFLIATGSLLRRVLLHKSYPAFQPTTNAPTNTYIQPTFLDSLINFLPRLSLRKESPQVTQESNNSQSASSSSSKMRYHRHRRRRSRGKKKQKAAEESETESMELVLPTLPKQPYDAFLVLDIEGTCKLGTDFNYPNEIIELPVCILEWKDKSEDGTAATLEIVNEFRTFVKPTWRPQLSDFCKELTGISQEQVDAAPTFSEVLVHLEAFLVDNGLIEEGTGKRLKKFCWCSDGPFDIRDFVVKQCFISQVEMPLWVQGDVLDVRSTVLQWMCAQADPPTTPLSGTPPSIAATRRALNIAAQLQVLDLPPFEGRQHSGIDDTRNIAKVVTELARRGVCLLPNTAILPGRRWRWMGKPGQVLEEGMI